MDKMTQDKKENYDEGKLLAKLQKFSDECDRYYQREERRMRLLDSTDKGHLWKAIKAKFPPYQLLPDTNYVSYVKNNLLASLYTVSKSPQIIPTCEKDAEICETLNVVIERIWDTNMIGFYQFEAGERAALLNLCFTQVYWDEDKKKVGFKTVDPMRFRRDPFADDLQSGGYCYTFAPMHKAEIMRHPIYKKPFKENFIDKKTATSKKHPPDYNGKPNIGDSDKHYIIYVFWVKNKDGGIDEVHTVDNDIVLLHKKDIQPNKFPFAPLYCNLPGSSLIGSSEPAKIFANNVVYNLMDSIAYTSEYKNQRPPKFVNTQSGLNLAAFTKHGDEANRTFVVNGDASKAVHYHEFPQVGNGLPGLQMTMASNISKVSGVDDRYTGRDTGSIITTGGTEEMLNRVTLIDTPKIMNYEKYTKDLADLVIRMLVEFAPKSKYIIRDDMQSKPGRPVYKTIEIDFPEVEIDDILDYSIQISSELPKNKQRIQAWADRMMEKQMQYQQAGMSVDVITPEEWIRCQDVPYKEQMLHRMGIQAGLNAYLEAQNVIAEYAAMLENGQLPEEALTMAADGLQAMRQGEMTPFQQQMEGAEGQPMDGMTGLGVM